MARVFESEWTPFVVVDLDQEAVAKAADDGYLCLQGNATSDDILKEAGIHQARGLVAAVGNDADDIYITLSAKGIQQCAAVAASYFWKT